MKILVTGGRSPYTLELIRLLGSAGHTIISVEFLKMYLSKYSKYIYRDYIITAPNEDSEKFKKELIEIIKNEKIDMVIPTCEEIFHLSKIKQELRQYTNVFFEGLDVLSRLHSKFFFMEDIKSLGLTHPKTFRLSEYNGELANHKIVLKKDFSRFASNVHIIQEDQVNNLNLEDTSEWVIQEFIPGQEGSIYIQVNDGRICAYSCYLKKFSVNGGATIMFKHENNPVLFKWIDNYINSYPIKLTGQFSFDVILSDKGQVYPIECNPRPTSGLHLFSEQNELVEGFFNKTKLIVPQTENQRMIALAMIIYSSPFKNPIQWCKNILRSSDVIFSFKDPLPFFTQLWAFAYLAIIAFKNKIQVIEASTLDIEYNQAD